MLGVVTLHNQEEKSKTTGFIRECPNLISLVAELTEETFQMIGGTDMAM